MPDSSQPSTRSTSAGSILLLEEYDALAAALRSALKKFAPDRSIRTASSLSQADGLAKSVCPALFIIDFESGCDGLTAFLLRMRGLCPAARTLLIGTGVSNETASEFRPFGSLYFIKKPFEISEFGAAVQALLGPGNGESSRLRGSLGSLGVADAVLAQCAGGRTIALEIKSKGGGSGEVRIVDGQIVHAQAGKRRDGDALEVIFGWPEPRIEEIEKTNPAARTIHEPWADVFLEAVRRAKPRAVAPSARPFEPLPPKPSLKTGKKIVVVDDTEMLLVFVEDTLTIADPELQITTAPNGVTGVKHIEQTMPDLVLLDYSLPDINGDEVCRRLLANERTAQIPILMMSGHVPQMTAAAQDFGNIVATIAKPFMSEAFVALVQQTLKAGKRPTSRVRKPVEAPKPTPPKQEPKPPPPPVEPPKRAEPPPIVVTKPPPPPIQVVPPTPVVLPPAPIPQRSTIIAPVITEGPNEVVLGLFLEVLSMQLTPTLRMGTIRAKPSSLNVSLHVSPSALRAVLPVETGFHLGRIDLGADGKIDSVRLIPTLQPFQPQQTRNALQIGALDLVPHNSREHVRLTPAQDAPMMMHLLAHFELAGVELGANFQVAHLVLKNRSPAVRVTLSPQAVEQEQSGVFCETAGVLLDNSARIAELLLKPLK